MRHHELNPCIVFYFVRDQYLSLSSSLIFDLIHDLIVLVLIVSEDGNFQFVVVVVLTFRLFLYFCVMGIKEQDKLSRHV